MSPIAAYREEGATNGFIPRTLVCVLQQYRRSLGPVLTCSSIAESLHDYVLLAIGIYMHYSMVSVTVLCFLVCLLS